VVLVVHGDFKITSVHHYEELPTLAIRMPRRGWRCSLKRS